MVRYSEIQNQFYSEQKLWKVLWIARFRWYITRTKQKVHKIDITPRSSIVEQFARRCVKRVSRLFFLMSAIDGICKTICQ